MAKKHNKIQKKQKSNYKFMIGLVFVGVCLVVASLVNNAFNSVDVEAYAGGGSTKEVKSFQPTDTKKHIPEKLIWGRDF